MKIVEFPLPPTRAARDEAVTPFRFTGWGSAYWVWDIVLHVPAYCETHRPRILIVFRYIYIFDLRFATPADRQYFIIESENREFTLIIPVNPEVTDDESR